MILMTIYLRPIYINDIIKIFNIKKIEIIGFLQKTQKIILIEKWKMNLTGLIV